MNEHQKIKALLREYVNELKKTEKKGDSWSVATDDTLMLNKPGAFVEPDVRDKISKFLKSMGLMK